MGRTAEWDAGTFHYIKLDCLHFLEDSPFVYKQFTIKISAQGWCCSARSLLYISCFEIVFCKVLYE